MRVIEFRFDSMLHFASHLLRFHFRHSRNVGEWSTHNQSPHSSIGPFVSFAQRPSVRSTSSELTLFADRRILCAANIIIIFQFKYLPPEEIGSASHQFCVVVDGGSVCWRNFSDTGQLGVNRSNGEFIFCMRFTGPLSRTAT